MTSDIEKVSRNGKNGDVNSCLQMLQYYARGAKGLEKDTREAKRWGQRAISFAADNASLRYQKVSAWKYKNVMKKASDGDPDSCIQMAIWCATGTSETFTDISLAKMWIDKAVTLYADSTNEANPQLHKDYSGISTDELIRMANNGDVNSCLQMLQYYARGAKGLEKNTWEAKRWGQRAISFAAEDPSLRYQNVSAWKYENVMKKASDGDPDSCIQMAIWCGTGTSKTFTDISQAKMWIDKAVTLYADSTKEASPQLHKDYNGISTDELIRMANNGDASACMALVHIYTRGNSSVFPDKQVASHWLDLAESLQPGISKSAGSNYSYNDGEDNGYDDDRVENNDHDGEERSVYFNKNAFLKQWFSNQIKFEL
ncbi:MAG: hypothetical protein SO096_05710 [Prevotella sp.]|nr:hypothetical protein [Bacteroidales bacterium]MDY4955945.1 hypothetical protein [Prevotella sp.]